MPYVVDPTNVNSPANSDDAEQGAEELRALKAYLKDTQNEAGGAPSIIFLSTGATFVYADQQIHIYRIGLRIFVDFVIFSSGAVGGTSTNALFLRLVNLPAMAAAGADNVSVACGYSDAGAAPALRLNSSTFPDIIVTALNGGAPILASAVGHSGAGFYGSFNYSIDSIP